jgi:hypothetical protein
MNGDEVLDVLCCVMPDGSTTFCLTHEEIEPAILAWKSQHWTPERNAGKVCGGFVQMRMLRSDYERQK